MPLQHKYTIVQHSGYGYGKDVRFKKGLEVRSCGTAWDQERVQKAGGLLFDTYEEASAYETFGAYPPGVQGLIPQAPGTFAKHKIDGLAIYIPTKETEAKAC